MTCNRCGKEMTLTDNGIGQMFYFCSEVCPNAQPIR